MALSDWDKEMLALLDGRAKHLPNVRSGLNKTQISAKAVDAYRDAQTAKQTADDAYADAQDALNGTILDDGVNPAVPTATAPAVELRPRSLIVTWDPPARLDFVKHTIVTVERPVGVTVVRTRNVVGTTTVFSSLVANSAHRVKLQHVDIFGHVSTVLTVGDFTPPAFVITDPDDQVKPDTIIAGDLKVAMGITTGTINAGGTQITSTGMTLQDASKLEGSFPGNAGDWITPKAGANVPSPFAGIGFFNDSPSSTRGIVMRASGASGGPNVGRVIISADNGDQSTSADTTARVRLMSTESGRASIELKGDVEVTGNINEGTEYSGILSGGGAGWSGTVGQPMGARRIGKMVILEGQPTATPGVGSSVGNIPTICQLPAGMRPARVKRFVVPHTDATSSDFWVLNRRIGIDPGGQVHLLEGASNEVPNNQQISLDGVAFTLD